MSVNDSEYREYITHLFLQNSSDYNALIKKYADLPELGHFLYYICCPTNISGRTRPEIRIIGMTSLIEAMMSRSIKYMDVFSYFKMTYKGENQIHDVDKFRIEYLDKYGATKKVEEYFEKYMLPCQPDIRKYGFSIFKGGSFEPLETSRDVARFLYSMRSEFVHKAQMIDLRPANVDYAFITVGKDHYGIDIDVDSFLSYFEKSFVLFWTTQKAM